MKKRSKVILIMFAVVFASIILVVIALSINPLLRTEVGIRRHLLRSTPIGTSIEDVLQIFGIDDTEIRSHGVVLHNTLRIPLRSVFPNDVNDPSRVLGNSHIWKNLGSYQLIVRIDVEAVFVFDENGHLMEVFVRKGRDLI